jgi:monoamine oxidase
MSVLAELREPEGRIAFAGADIANALPGFDGAIET